VRQPASACHHAQAKRLGRWLKQVTTIHAESILPLDEETAHVWGRLRVPNAENPLDKQIAATALIHIGPTCGENRRPTSCELRSRRAGGETIRLERWFGIAIQRIHDIQ